jgi:hypothetical protein
LLIYKAQKLRLIAPGREETEAQKPQGARKIWDGSWDAIRLPSSEWRAKTTMPQFMGVF